MRDKFCKLINSSKHGQILLLLKDPTDDNVAINIMYSPNNIDKYTITLNFEGSPIIIMKIFNSSKEKIEKLIENSKIEMGLK